MHNKLKAQVQPALGCCYACVMVWCHIITASHEKHAVCARPRCTCAASVHAMNRICPKLAKRNLDEIRNAYIQFPGMSSHQFPYHVVLCGLIIESIWAKKRGSTGALGALDDMLLVETKI